MTRKQYDELLQRLQNPVATKVHPTESVNPWGDFTPEEIEEAAVTVRDILGPVKSYPQPYISQSYSMSWVGGASHFTRQFEEWVGKNLDLAQLIIASDVFLELVWRLTQHYPELRASLWSMENWNNAASSAWAVRRQLRERAAKGALQSFSHGMERLWRIVWEDSRIKMRPDHVLTYWWAAFMRRVPIRNGSKSVMAWPEPSDVWLLWIQEYAAFYGRRLNGPMMDDLWEPLWDAPGGENEAREGWPETWWETYVQAAWDKAQTEAGRAA